jgi:hypothetical protein
MPRDPFDPDGPLLREPPDREQNGELRAAQTDGARDRAA